jgi:hypothetical protein
MERWLPIGFFVLFPAFWCFVCILLAHIGGWSALADHYRSTERPEGEAFFMQSGRVGVVHYGSCLTIRVDETGLFLAVFPLWRVGHPRLFVPRSEFNNFRENRMMFCRFVEAAIGTPPITRLLLRPGIIPGKVLEACLQPPPPSR